MNKILTFYQLSYSFNFSLEEENRTEVPAPVEVKGSDLVLTGALDKEGLDGPSSFAVNVRCRRRKLRKTAAILERRPDVSLKGKYSKILQKNLYF